MINHTRDIDCDSARLRAEAVGKILGFTAEDVCILTKHGLLGPLGKPVPNAPKYFAKAHIIELSSDIKWLSKATQCVSDHWKAKNARKSQNHTKDAHQSFVE